MLEQTFTTTLPADPGFLLLEVPAEVAPALGAKKRPLVVVTMNDAYSFRSTVAIYSGRFYPPLRREVREGAGLAPGMMVRVRLTLDEEPRTVEAPEDLRAALETDLEADAAFARLSFSHQREYVEWIAGAKRMEARQRRIHSALERLRVGKPAG
jgi:hypothetical protein